MITMKKVLIFFSVLQYAVLTQRRKLPMKTNIG